MSLKEEKRCWGFDVLDVPCLSFPAAGVALDSSVFKGKALKGCGTCVEVKCQDEVRQERQ